MSLTAIAALVISLLGSLAGFMSSAEETARTSGMRTNHKRLWTRN